MATIEKANRPPNASGRSPAGRSAAPAQKAGSTQKGGSTEKAGSTQKGGSTRKGSLSTTKRLTLRVKVLMRRPGIQHLMRAAKRFSERLGSQFAGAITYFSFLALVPILMVAFSIAGFVLHSRPDLLVQLQNKITQQIPGGLSSTISEALSGAVNARLSVGIVGLVLALYSGINWMGNIRQAVQAQWRPDFDDDQELRNQSFIKNLTQNLWMLVGLGLAILVSLVFSSVGGALATDIQKWLGLANVSWLHPVVVAVSLVLAVAADLLIFMWVYTVLPPAHMKATRSNLIRGSLIAAIIFEVLKFALTYILPTALSGGTTGKIFGPIIGLLAFFNLVATFVLFMAAWIATAVDGPGQAKAGSDEEEIPEAALVVRSEVSRPKLAGLIGVGAVLGWGWSAARRRR